MKKVNNKGFAITGILYSILILFMLVIVSFLTALSNKKDYLYNLTNSIQNELDMNKTHDVNQLLGTYVTDYRGKYAIANNNCTSYFYLPMETKIEKVSDNEIRFNDSTTINLCSCLGTDNYSCASTTTEKSDYFAVTKVYTSYEEVDRVIPRLDLPNEISVLDEMLLSERAIFGHKGGTTSCTLESYNIDDPEDEEPTLGQIDELDNLPNGTYNIKCTLSAGNGIVIDIQKNFKMVEPVIEPFYKKTPNSSSDPYYTYTVPVSGYYKLETWGAQGSGYSSAVGGKGGYSKGLVYLEKNTALYMYVGAQAVSNIGGYNGGGNGYNAYTGGGGGGTDIRLTSGAWNNSDSLNSRLIVAGGGGGSGRYYSSSGSWDYYTGGYGGGRTASGGGGGGTQTSPGAYYSGSAGSFGVGGNGKNTSNAYGGGGGGGWYGGGGGYSSESGGGGSGYVYTIGSYTSAPTGYSLDSKYYMLEADTFNGSESFPDHANSSSSLTGNTGNGAAKITYVSRKHTNSVNMTYEKSNYDFYPYYTYVVKKTGYYKLETWGAQGVGYSSSALGGKGGYSKGTILLEKDTILYIYVGGQGVSATGGYNGGGNSSSAGGGGGGTDIRLTSGAWNNSDSLNSRLIVAGGGGGYGRYYSSSGSWDYYTAGNGGGYTGGSGGGGGGTPTSPGANYSTTAGSFGVGGTGKNTSNSYGGGAGGGWYGGGGGYSSEAGGGGSGYVYNEVSAAFAPDTYTVPTKYYFTDFDTIDGASVMPTVDGNSTMTGNADNGAVKITFSAESMPEQGTDILYDVPNKTHYPYYIYTVEKAGYYDLETWGAQGGYRSDSTYGGKGGYSKGTFYLTKGTKLYIYVGQSGNNSGSTGGYNGGGSRSSYNGGGGASDIRLTPGTWNDANSLNSRLIVAGGGGSDGKATYGGGYGGGIIGGTSAAGCGSGGGGATQTAPGYTGNTTNAGGFGYGGKGVYANSGYGGAGGGGWYGGAGNTADSSGDDDKGGGGGSGFVWSEQYATSVPDSYTVASSYYAYNPKLLSGVQTMPSHTDSSTMIGNAGDGAVKISYAGTNEPEIPTDVTYTEAGSTTLPYEMFIIQKSGYYDLETWGAQGGATYGTGGKGGYSKGTVYLTKGTRLYSYIGGQGGSSGGSGGYNGGGRSSGYGGQGGGASDIRLTPGVWNDTTSLNSRLIVAGGGGGGQANSSYSYVGGAGGGEIAGSGIGSSSSYLTYGGMLDTGGYAYSTSNSTTSGTFGVGGGGYYNSSYSSDSGGAGGGGWYGGAGGYSRTTGAGGSGFVWCYNYSFAKPSTYNVSTDYYAYNAILKRGDETVPTVDGNSTMTGKTGNGAVKITYVGDTKPTEPLPTGKTYTSVNNNTFKYYTYFVTHAGYYDLEVWGAKGGATYGTGGKGGYSKGTVYLTKGSKIYIYLGAQGGSSGGSGSYNGGGRSSSYAGQGGGATDIRLTPGSWNDTTSLNSRLIVAGGGGGGQANSSYPLAGGRGGGLFGGDGISSNSSSYYAYGATQSAGGVAYSTSNSTTSGTFGVGGGGYYNSSYTNDSGGAGGGGWYGGAGGYSRTTGSGGSGFVFTNTSTVPSGYSVPTTYQLFNTVLKSGNQTIPTVDGNSTMTGNNSDGAAKITYLGTTKPAIDPSLINPVIDPITYTTTNNDTYHTYTAAASGYYDLQVWGAQGGARYGTGGKGGYARGVVYLPINTNLYIYVGGQGSYTTEQSYLTGGYNGGGSAANSAGTGGGASDIRLIPGSSSADVSLKSRIIVAGGGGGAQGYSGSAYTGGYGGGLSGGNATYSNSSYYAYGGSQTSGGNLYSTNYGSTGGIFGVGGTGGFYANSTSYAGGGGGGGWYGGAGGYYNRTTGAGGSGFIFTSSATLPSGYSVNSSYYLMESRIFSGNNTIPTVDGSGTMTGNAGGGTVKISFIGIDY